MAIRGSLSEASLPDVLQLLAMGKKSGCLSVSPRSSFGYIDAELTAEQRAVLQHIDGARNVHAIVDATGLVEFDVAKALYGLLTAGFIHRITPAPAGRPTAQIIAARTDEHRNLGDAFYRANM